MKGESGIANGLGESRDASRQSSGIEQGDERGVLRAGLLENVAQIDVSHYCTLGFSNENEDSMPFCKTPLVSQGHVS